MVRVDEHGGVDFLLDAPAAGIVEVTIYFGHGGVRTLGMRRRDDGRWHLHLPGAAPGIRYRFRIDGNNVSEETVPEPLPGGWVTILEAA
ncbi:MAG: hypothetical protein VX012_01375 [Planctomycetota bacterium]|nr:hypothetical protein [Planctomycetota bacterium]